ncbi:MAG: zinc-dependent peptidase [Armatimonadota bacterium]
MNLNGLFNGILGAAVNYGINQLTNPYVQVDNNIQSQISQMQSQLAAKFAMINQGALGSPGSSGGIVGSIPMYGGLNSFWNSGVDASTATGVINKPTIEETHTSAQEISASLSAEPQDREALINGLLDDKLAQLVAKDPNTLTKTDIYYLGQIKKLKEDLKDVPTEALELLKKNGTKIKISTKGDSLQGMGVIKVIDSSGAEKTISDIVGVLNQVKENNGFKNIDTSVIGKTFTDLKMTYVSPDKNSTDVKGIDVFKDQIAKEAVSVSGNESMGAEMAEILSSEAQTKQFKEYLEKRKTDKPEDLQKTEKLIELVNMWEAARNLPVKHDGQYYRPQEYEVIRAWDSGEIESLYSNTDKTLYLKDDVLGKVMSEKDAGKVAVHELAHALEKSLQDLVPDVGNSITKKVEEYYKENAEKDQDAINIDPNGTNEFITPYSSTCASEYFAETVAAYFYPPKAEVLKKTDPKQYNLLNALFTELGIAKQIAMGNVQKTA